MRRDTLPRFREVDVVTDGDGNTGLVVSCLNHRTRETFLSVRVTHGPKQGQWDKLYLYTPFLDHDGGTVRTTCVHCDRSFLATPRVLEGLNGTVLPRQSMCRTCQPVEQRQRAAEEAHAEPAHVMHDRLHRPWREDEKAAPAAASGPRRPEEDLFKDTPF